jgi:peptidyl-prolyl cis-trans isomerase B (cyclophilin B)
MADLKPEQMEKLTAVIETSQGTIKFKFFPREAPGHCNNFIKLAQQGFYNGLIFHRVIEGFMIQGGCPQGSGTGGPGWQIKAEFNEHPHVDGTVSMARSNDPDSAGSQFFICHGTQKFLDGKYTAFGQVSEGLEVVHTIAATKTVGNDRPVEKQVMKKVYIEGL